MNYIIIHIKFNISNQILLDKIINGGNIHGIIQRI